VDPLPFGVSHFFLDHFFCERTASKAMNPVAATVMAKVKNAIVSHPEQKCLSSI
jgi:hypothetical protein